MSILSQKWRLNNLYRIIDRNSNSVKFTLNAVQNDVLDNLHNRNLILKARQLGMSTFAVIFLLDETLFNENLSSGIVSYSLEHAQHIFKKIIGHALDTLPPEIKDLAGVIQRSAREINFNNGSSLRVDTTLRGGSYPLVLISEFGKTCARNPQKAEEVITGTLQAVPPTGRVIIESTGEGNEGFFAEMVMDAHRRKDESLTSLDYRLFFYPWMDEPSYQLEERVECDVFTTDYLNSVEKATGRKITTTQRNWYSLQQRFLGDKVKQEFPSTVTEAFLTSSDAFYFADAINKAYVDNRALFTPLYDALFPVYIAMDIGVNDLTVIVFFQVIHGEVRIFDYYEDSNKGVDFYAHFLLHDKKLLYNTIFLPHDSARRNPLDVTNTYARDFQRLFSGTSARFIVLPRMDKQLSISHTKIMINRSVFNAAKVKPLLDHLCKYRKKWSESQGRYLEEPQESVSDHFADAFRYVAQAVAHIESGQGLLGALEKHRRITEARYKKVI